jgi:hypothetical protein
VRLASIQAISEAANGEYCENCKQRSCCSEEISKKLYEIAYERDEEGCFLEPSERVRLAAAEALRVCCPGSGEGFIVEERPMEMPGGERPAEPPPAGGERPGVAPPAVPLQPVPAPMPPMPPMPPPPAPVAPASAPGPLTEPALEFPRSSRRTAALLGSSTVPVSAASGVNAPTPAASDANQGENLAPIRTASSMRRVPPGSGVRLPPPPDAPASSGPVFSAPPLPQVSNEGESSPAAKPAPGETQSVVQASGQRSTATHEVAHQSARATADPTAAARPAMQRKLPGAEFGTGIVTSVRLREGLAYIEFDANGTVPRGSVVRAYHEFALTTNQAVCDLEVILSEPGMAIAKPKAGSRIGELAVGDHAIVLR